MALFDSTQPVLTLLLAKPDGEGYACGIDLFAGRIHLQRDYAFPDAVAIVLAKALNTRQSLLGVPWQPPPDGTASDWSSGSSTPSPPPALPTRSPTSSRAPSPPA